MPIVKQLIADTFGSHVGKYSQRLKITQNGQTLGQAPILYLESVHILSRGVSISADALEICCEHGIPVYFVDSIGTPYASIYAAGLAGTVKTRREQIRAYDDERGVILGKQFAVGKIQNQATTLKYLAKNRQDSPEGQALSYAAMDVNDCTSRIFDLKAEQIKSIRASLMAVEGYTARLYWKAVRDIIPESYEWTERKGRGAVDPINSLLN